MSAISRPVILRRRAEVPAIAFMPLVTAGVVFLLFINATGVAISSHGAPAAVGLVLIALLVLPVASNLVGGGASLVLSPVLWWLLGFLGVQVISTALSDFQPEAAAQLVQFVVEGIILFLLITNAIRSEEDLRRAVWALVLAAAALGFLTIVQRVTGTFLRPYGGFARLPSNYLSGFSRVPRAAGPLGDPNYYAQILLPAVPLALHLMRARGRPGRRALASVALVCCLSGILLTSSRGAGLGLLALLAVATVLRVVRPKGLVLGVLGIIVVLAAVPSYRGRVATVSALVSATGDGGAPESADVSIRSRATEMRAAANVYVDHPVVGAGPGVFPLYYQSYAQRIGRDIHEEVKSGARRGEVPQREAHNIFLGVAAEAGTTGLLAFTGALIAVVGGLVRARKRSAGSQPELAALAAAVLLAIVGYVTAGLFLSLAFERYFWLLLAMGASATQLLRHQVGLEPVARRGGSADSGASRSSRYDRKPRGVVRRPQNLPTAPARAADVSSQVGRASVESSNFLRLIARWWRIILCAGLLSGAASAAVASRLPPTYESSVQLLTGPTNTSFETLRAAGELARTYAALAVTQPLLQSVADELGIKGGVPSLKERVSVSASTVSRLVTVSVRDEDPRVAVRTATAIAERLLALRRVDGEQASSRIDELLRRRELAGFAVEARDAVRLAAEAVLGPPEAGVLTVVNPAGPSQKVGPKSSLLITLSVLGGVLGSAGLAVLSAVVRRRVDSDEQLADLTGLPCLASVKAARRCPSRTAISSSLGDPYRLLATKLGLFQVSAKAKGVVVVGADDAAEAGAVACALAAAVAAAGVRATLIDAKVGDANITRAFRAGELPGYGDLGPGVELTDIWHAIDEDLILIPAGASDKPLDRTVVGSLLDELQRSGAEVVVVAVPPISRSSACVLWSDAVDVCLLVARRGHTRSAAVADAAEALSQTGASLAGTALVVGHHRLPSRLVAELSHKDVAELSHKDGDVQGES